MRNLMARRKSALVSFFPRMLQWVQRRAPQQCNSQECEPIVFETGENKHCKLSDEPTHTSFSPRALNPCTYELQSRLEALISNALLWPLFFHVVVVLLLQWCAGYVQFNCLFSVFCGGIYLREVDRRQKEWLEIRKRRDFEEEKSRAKPFTDTESMEWFNALMEKIWGSWLEFMLSKMVAECLYANMEFYKPQALSKLSIAALSLGSSPPIFKSVKVYRVHDKLEDPRVTQKQVLSLDQEVIVELDFSYVAGDGMRVEFDAKMMGIDWRLVGNNLAVKGKLRAGLKFVPYYPYVALLKLSFEDIPELHLSLRPLSSNSVDVLDLPGVASWVQRTLRECIADSMVEPRQLEFDLIKLLGTSYGGMADTQSSLHIMRNGQIRVMKRTEVAFAVVEVLEARGLEAKDSNSLLDPYVRMKMGRLKLHTQVKKKNMAPAWNEIFRLPISSWDAPTTVHFILKDRDILGTKNNLGHCSLDLSNYRDGERHDLQLRLTGCKLGQLRVAVTVVEEKPCSLSPSPLSDNGTPTLSSTEKLYASSPSLASLSSDSLSESVGGSSCRFTKNETQPLESLSSFQRRQALFLNRKEEANGGLQLQKPMQPMQRRNLETENAHCEGEEQSAEVRSQCKKRNHFLVQPGKTLHSWFHAKPDQPTMSHSRSMPTPPNFDGMSDSDSALPISRSEPTATPSDSLEGCGLPNQFVERDGQRGNMAVEKDAVQGTILTSDYSSPVAALKATTEHVGEHKVLERRRSISQVEELLDMSPSGSVITRHTETWEFSERQPEPCKESAYCLHAGRRGRKHVFPPSVNVKAELVDLCAKLILSHPKEQSRHRRRSLSPPLVRPSLQGKPSGRGYMRCTLDALDLEVQSRNATLCHNSQNQTLQRL